MIDWGSRTRAGSIEVDYQTELKHLVLSVFIQVWGVVMIGITKVGSMEVRIKIDETRVDGDGELRMRQRK